MEGIILFYYRSDVQCYFLRSVHPVWPMQLTYANFVIQPNSWNLAFMQGKSKKYSGIWHIRHLQIIINT